MPFEAAAGLVLAFRTDIGGRVGQRRRGAEPFQDAFGDGAPGVAGLLRGTLGAHRILPPAGQSRFGAPNGAVGLRRVIQRDRQGFGGAAVAGFGGGQRVQRLGPPGGDRGRPRFQGF